MATTALGIMQSGDGAGVDPLTHRRIIRGRWSNTGIITGLEVTGGSGLTYSVSAGNAVLSRSDSDGFTEAYWEGGATPAVSTGDPSNPRVDTIWLKAHDTQQGDPDNRVHVGVTQGTPSSSPVAPPAPSGCLAVARMLVPAGATSTASAQQTSARDYAIPYGSTLGLLAYNQDTRNMFGSKVVGQTYVENSVSVTVPTDRLLELVYSATFTNADIDEGTWGGDSIGAISWGVYAFMMDGKEIAHSGCEWQGSNNVWEDHEVHCLVTVSAGTHSFAVKNGLFGHKRASDGPYFAYGATDKNPAGYKGRILQVWDRGVAR